MLGVSHNTLANWYRFKKLHPEHELCKYLPDPSWGKQHTRKFWTAGEVKLLMEFKHKLPRGRNGILSEITQKYIKRR